MTRALIWLGLGLLALIGVVVVAEHVIVPLAVRIILFVPLPIGG